MAFLGQAVLLGTGLLGTRNDYGAIILNGADKPRVPKPAGAHYRSGAGQRKVGHDPQLTASVAGALCAAVTPWSCGPLASFEDRIALLQERLSSLLDVLRGVRNLL